MKIESTKISELDRIEIITDDHVVLVSEISTNTSKQATLEQLKGNSGLSAYEVAIDNGFVGTETEWIESLKGEQGPKGDPGGSIPSGLAGGDLAGEYPNPTVAHISDSLRYFDFSDWMGMPTGTASGLVCLAPHQEGYVIMSAIYNNPEELTLAFISFNSPWSYPCTDANWQNILMEMLNDYRLYQSVSISEFMKLDTPYQGFQLNNGSRIGRFMWEGTKTQYDAIPTKDNNTYYFVEGTGIYRGTVLFAKAT